MLSAGCFRACLRSQPEQLTTLCARPVTAKPPGAWLLGPEESCRWAVSRLLARSQCVPKHARRPDVRVAAEIAAAGAAVAFTARRGYRRSNH
jgi:hypothetical protein